MSRLVPTNKHAVVELNHVTAVKDGSIVAQYDMAMETIDNGTLLMVDHAKKQVKLPTAKTDEVYLVASQEKLYETKQGREDFVNEKNGFGIRLYKLVKGDIFETNAVEMGAIVYATAKTEIAGGTAYYGIPSTNGDITLTKTVADTTGCAVILQAVEAVTLPNGRQGFKFVVKTGL